MMWKSFFRVQNFFSEFLNVPIAYDKESETFKVTPCNTLWRKIKRFVLTNLCLFAIWGISIYRLLHQLLTFERDANFTVLDVVIISIALAFCTEGLTHIWTFHFCAEDICYILTELLKLTKRYCYGAAVSTWRTTTTGSNINEGPNFSSDPESSSSIPLESPQWSGQASNTTNQFSKEELIMYGIAVGFNGFPLVCFLAPLMTSSDPASYLMREIVFPNSPIIGMLAASFFQGLTAFYASLLSLNLILVCLTVVCEISAVICTSYPAGKVKRGTLVSSTDGQRATSTTPGYLGKVGDSKIEEDNSEFLLVSWRAPTIRIDNYDKRDDDAGEERNERVEKGQQHQVSEPFAQSQKFVHGPKTRAGESHSVRKLSKSPSFQVVSPQPEKSFQLHALQLQNLQPPGPSSSLQSSGAGNSGSTRGTASSMLMMKIIEELGPVEPPPSAIPMVKKLMCPPPTQRIKSSAEILFVKSFKLYLQTKLLVLFINSAMFYYFPVVISVGMALTTLSAYATIKLHSFLPLPLRLSILLIGLTVATVMWLLMMESTEITRHSEEFLRYWRRRLKAKYTRKQLRTCQKLCFRIGPFIEFKKNIIFEVFSTVQHFTVNLAVIKL